MKISVFSDLHLEYRDNSRIFHQEFKERYPKGCPKNGIAILAGDIGTWDPKVSTDSLLSHLRGFSRAFEEIYYISGNHENYHTSIPTAFANFQSIKSPENVHLLYPGVTYKTPDGRTIRGGTGWFPPGFPIVAKRVLTDFRTIQNLIPDAHLEYDLFKEHVVGKMATGDIVVSHHAPSANSVHPMFKGEISNWFFHNNFNKEIVCAQPVLWIHGHTHHPFDYKLGNTMVYCNPRGYQFEGANPKFWDRIEIEV